MDLIVIIWYTSQPPTTHRPFQAFKIYESWGGKLSKGDFYAKIMQRKERISFSDKEIIMWLSNPQDYAGVEFAENLPEEDEDD